VGGLKRERESAGNKAFAKGRIGTSTKKNAKSTKKYYFQRHRDSKRKNLRAGETLPKTSPEGGGARRIKGNQGVMK